MKIEDACPTCGALCEVDLDADEEEYVAIDVAAHATAEQRDSVIETCALIVERHQETFTTMSGGEEERHLTTRRHGNQMGMAYANAIRALKSQQDAAIESKQAEQSADTERLNFTESASTTWYPGRAPNGYGVLCYDIKGRHRAETFGKTMRQAIDAAIESQSGDGS